METCRICLLPVSQQIVSLSSVIGRRTAAEMINFCCGIEIAVNDNYSQNVCCDCWAQVLTAYKIKTLCINSDKILRGVDSKVEDNLYFPVAIKSEPEVLEVSVISDIADYQQSFNESYENSGTYTSKTAVKQEQFDDYDSFIPEIVNNQDETEDFEGISAKLSKTSKKSSGKKVTGPVKLEKSEQKIQKCYFCNETFKSRQKKREHIKTIHCLEDLTCKLCNHKSVTLVGLDNHLMLHENPHLLSHMCHFCSKNFQHISKLNYHIQQCHSDKSKLPNFFCDLCEFKSHSKPNLSRHMRTLHLKIKAFQCPICPDKRYTSKIPLEQHLISKHGQESDIVCRNCGLKFPTNSYLKQHKKQTCTGGSRVKRAGYVPSHEYQEKIDENYRCKICSRIFADKQKIRLHFMQIHRHSNKCEICFKQFYSFSSLSVHRKTVHENIRKYKCDTCGKSFSENNKLINHTYTHTGEKPYKCKFEPCQFRSGEPSTITKHKKKCIYNPENCN